MCRQHWKSTKQMAFSSARASFKEAHVAIAVDDSNGKSDDTVNGDTSPMSLSKDGDDHATASIATQSYYLGARHFRMWRRHPMMLIGEGVQYIFLALFVGGMYFDLSSRLELGTFERQAALFYILVTIVFTPPFTAVSVYQSERGLLRREVNQHTYSLTAFFVSKTLTLLPMETLASFVICAISYFMMGLQRDAGKFFIFFLTMLLSLLVAESIGLLLALITTTAEFAIILMSLIFIVILSFTGFLAPETPVYYEWIQHISFLRYGNSALFINEMKGLTLFDEDGTTVAGEDILDGNALNNDVSLWGNIAILAGFLVFIRCAALAGIHLAHRFNWL